MELITLSEERERRKKSKENFPSVSVQEIQMEDEFRLHTEHDKTEMFMKKKSLWSLFDFSDATSIDWSFRTVRRWNYRSSVQREDHLDWFSRFSSVAKTRRRCRWSTCESFVHVFDN